MTISINFSNNPSPASCNIPRFPCIHPLLLLPFPAPLHPSPLTLPATHSVCSQLPFLVIPTVSLPWGSSMAERLELPYFCSAKECLNPSLQAPSWPDAMRAMSPAGIQCTIHPPYARCLFPWATEPMLIRSPSLPAVAADSGPFNSRECPHSNTKSLERENRLLPLQSKMPMKDDAS